MLAADPWSADGAAGRRTVGAGPARTALATGLSLVALAGVPVAILTSLVLRRTPRWERADAVVRRRQARSRRSRFAARHRRVRWGATLGVIGLLGAGIGTAIRFSPDFRRSRVPAATGPAPVTSAVPTPQPAVPIAQWPAAVGLDYAHTLYDEQRFVEIEPDPVAGYGLKDLTSTHTNIVDGERVTWQAPPCSECIERTVWFVGGSGAFGKGQRDDHTIPSVLARLSAEDGTPWRIRNLGVTGYTLWQEQQRVLALLASGQPAPDLVVFYHGLNDLWYGMATAFSTGELPSEPTAFEAATVDAIDRFKVASPDSLEMALEPFDGPGGFGRLAGQRFERLQGLVQDQLSALGVSSAFVIQPDAAASPRQLDAAMVAETVIGRPQALLADVILDHAWAELDPSVVDLRHLFDDVDQPLFFDLADPNEAGAALIAEAAYERLRDRMSA